MGMMLTTHMKQDALWAQLASDIHFAELEGAPAAALLQNALLCDAAYTCGFKVRPQQ